MSAKHTPGPWFLSLEDKQDWLIKDAPHAIDAVDPADGKLFEVAAVWGIDRISEVSDQSMANARLIAAAPDLLEALQKMLHVWETGGVDVYPIYQARTAIAKATKPD